MARGEVADSSLSEDLRFSLLRAFPQSCPPYPEHWDYFTALTIRTERRGRVVNIPTKYS
jgi:hypothetical protein